VAHNLGERPRRKGNQMSATARRAWARYEEWVGERRRARFYASGVGVTFLLAALLPSVWTFLLFLWASAAVIIFQTTDLFQPEPSDEEIDEWF
jgi:hypothetical protein